ncbi:winged helix-turn-helix transcriptional regulator [Pseudooceanicola sp. LIPI14-2-Ac024]|uniref:winged helix-turn-helix transcriptional regulator n=1 Tax=Pseudooceanicola sp. LIPI14-2-Ac024 TaxID=3344875 RepID=UPI0035CEE885
MPGPFPSPLPPNVMSANCPSREVLRQLTSRWGLLVLIALRDGTFRFAELRRRIDGVSERMLSETLGNLVRLGLVTRHDHAEVPPRVDYALTELGNEAAERLFALAGWIEATLPAFDTAAPAAK